MFSSLYAQAEQAAPAAADAAQQAPGFNPQFFMMIGLMLAVMYFLIWRPQQKKQKELEKKRNSLEKGVKILTIGGVYGKVAKLKDDGKIVVLEISKDVTIDIQKSAVAHIIDGSEVIDEKK